MRTIKSPERAWRCGGKIYTVSFSNVTMTASEDTRHGSTSRGADATKGTICILPPSAVTMPLTLFDRARVGTKCSFMLKIASDEWLN